MTNKKIKRLTYLSLFIAIEFVISVVPFLGFIPLGAINATTLHIPVILAGILLGEKEGAVVGFVFGLMSMLKNTTTPMATSFIFSPFIEIGGVHGGWQSLLIAFIPRMLIGYGSGCLYKALTNKNENEIINMTLSAIFGSFINTILVMSGIYLFFGNAYASAMGVSYQALLTFILTIICTNGIAEAIVAAVLSTAVGKAAKKVIRL